MVTRPHYYKIKALHAGPRSLTRSSATSSTCWSSAAASTGSPSAYDAASRGLRVALVEAGDFGSGDLVQPSEDRARRPALAADRHAAAARASRSASAARWRASRRGSSGRCPSSSAPTARCCRNRLALRAAFRLDAGSAAIATTASSRSCICRRRGWSRRPPRCKLFPGISPERLTGGAQWYDYQMVETDRLTLAFAAAADRAGAELANYAAAVAALPRTGAASPACASATR